MSRWSQEWKHWINIISYYREQKTQPRIKNTCLNSTENCHTQLCPCFFNRILTSHRHFLPHFSSPVSKEGISKQVTDHMLPYNRKIIYSSIYPNTLADGERLPRSLTGDLPLEKSIDFTVLANRALIHEKDEYWRSINTQLTKQETLHLQLLFFFGFLFVCF